MRCGKVRTNTTGWQHLHHMADIGVYGFGPRLAVAFKQAAIALTAVITDPDRVLQRDAVDDSYAAPDSALLLGDWLNAWVYEMVVRRMLFSRFEATLV